MHACMGCHVLRCIGAPLLLTPPPSPLLVRLPPPIPASPSHLLTPSLPLVLVSVPYYITSPPVPSSPKSPYVHILPHPPPHPALHPSPSSLSLFLYSLSLSPRSPSLLPPSPPSLLVSLPAHFPRPIPPPPLHLAFRVLLVQNLAYHAVPVPPIADPHTPHPSPPSPPPPLR